MADKKCRQAVRKARRELNKGGGVLAACGCWAQGLGAGEAQALGIDILAGSRDKSALLAALEAFLSSGGGGKFTDARGSPRDAWDSLSLPRRPLLHTRAFLKVQEGCDRFCSYCVIPFLRGRPASRPLEDAVAEARRLTGEEGQCGEIVLTGVHLGMYGRDIGASLADLVRKISALSGLTRLRLGSLEPFALDGELLDALADSAAFCPHLHLPLQSGDDEILARMRRGYTANDFAHICEWAREKLGGDLHISSDVLVAFPGESEEAHLRTLALMRRAGLGRVHVFPYSPRKGTEAFGFRDRVPAKTAASRASEALALGKELLQGYASRFVGRKLSVLAEEASKPGGDDRAPVLVAGYTRNFISATVQSDSFGLVPAGQEVEARMTDCSGGELRGVSVPAREARLPRRQKPQEAPGMAN
jgi:threonylcarbamoyladenosine tRNA methylthiotransferase MtaB